MAKQALKSQSNLFLYLLSLIVAATSMYAMPMYGFTIAQSAFIAAVLAVSSWFIGLGFRVVFLSGSKQTKTDKSETNPADLKNDKDIKNKLNKVETKLNDIEKNIDSKSIISGPNKSIQSFVDICKHPKADKITKITKKNSNFTIGDLHGNALKLLHFLISVGKVSNVSKQDYDKFVKLYHKNITEFTKQDIAWFNKFVESFEVNRNAKITLIGDELADRGGLRAGANDWFTLSIIAKLAKEKSPVDITFSNHAQEFIYAHEANNGYNNVNLVPFQSITMLNLGHLVKANLISKKEIDNLLDKYYLPNLNLLSYQLSADKKTISLFTHAPAGVDAIVEVAKKLNVKFNDATASGLAKTIDAINASFQKNYVAKKRISAIFKPEYKGCHIDLKTDPVAYIMWNRDHTISRPAKHNGYNIEYIHGHDSCENSQPKHIHNLDVNLGKVDCKPGLQVVFYNYNQEALKDKIQISNLSANQQNASGLFWSKQAANIDRLPENMDPITANIKPRL